MTPYLLKGAKMLKMFSKTADAIGAVGGLVSDTVSACGEGANILKEKIDSSVEEEKIQQAKNRILAKVEAVKEIAAVTGLTMQEAEELLNQEMQNN